MKKKQVQRLRYAAAFLVSAAVGVGGCFVWSRAVHPVGAPAAAPNASQEQAAQAVQTDGVQVRVRGGVAEWFDGMRWNAAGTVEELEQGDPTAVQSETWQLVAQQRSAAKQQQRQSALEQLSREENALSTGEKPAAQTTQTRRPAAQTTTPAATPSAPAQTPTQTPVQTPPPTPTPTPQPEPEPAPTGDGEDLQISFD